MIRFQFQNCSNCGCEKEFEENVCTDCGLELSRDWFFDNPIQKSLPSTNDINIKKRPYYLNTAKYDVYLKYLRPLKDFTKQLCTSLSFETHMTECSLYWVEKVLQHEGFKKVHVANKHTICASVVVLVGRAWDFPIILADIHKAAAPMALRRIGAWKAVVGKIFEDLGKHDKGKPIMEVASIKCKILKLDESCVLKVKKLLGVLGDLWVSEGVSAEAMVFVCCYVAWVADKVTQRWNIPLSSFCKKFKINNNSTLKNHYHNVITTLTHLHQNLPWNITDDQQKPKQKKQINKKLDKRATLFFNLDDIINYSSFNMEQIDKVPFNGVHEDGDDNEVSNVISGGSELVSSDKMNDELVSGNTACEGKQCVVDCDLFNTKTKALNEIAKKMFGKRRCKRKILETNEPVSICTTLKSGLLVILISM